jgi:hypothetical protein
LVVYKLEVFRIRIDQGRALSSKHNRTHGVRWWEHNAGASASGLGFVDLHRYVSCSEPFVIEFRVRQKNEAVRRDERCIEGEHGGESAGGSHRFFKSSFHLLQSDHGFRKVRAAAAIFLKS